MVLCCIPARNDFCFDHGLGLFTKATGLTELLLCRKFFFLFVRVSVMCRKFGDHIQIDLGGQRKEFRIELAGLQKQGTDVVRLSQRYLMRRKEAFEVFLGSLLEVIGRAVCMPLGKELGNIQVTICDLDPAKCRFFIQSSIPCVRIL